VQRTGGSRRDLQAFSRLRDFSAARQSPRPPPAANASRWAFDIHKGKMVAKLKTILRNTGKVILALLGVLSVFALVYLSPILIEEITTKRYEKQPILSLAPRSISNDNTTVYEFSSSCYDRQTYSKNEVYEIEKTAIEVEAYYKQAMNKYCLTSDEQNLSFRSDLCFGTLADVGKRDCRYATCKLKDEYPSLVETISVEIFEVSSEKTAIVQTHEIKYLLKVSSNVPCGE
jgi:hypothetical protein